MPDQMKDILDLELERRALWETYHQLSAGDACMETTRNDLCKDILAQIELIAVQIDEHYVKLIDEERKQIDDLRKQLDIAVAEARQALTK